MYFEVWIDSTKRSDVLRRLLEVCDEVHEVFYDYQFIVKVDDEKRLEIDGVSRYKRHYDC